MKDPNLPRLAIYLSIAVSFLAANHIEAEVNEKFQKVVDLKKGT